MDNQNAISNLIETTLLAAGKAVMKFYDNNQVVSRKNNDPHAIVTQADLASQEVIIKSISAYFPDAVIIAEEWLNNRDPWATGDGIYWYVDPLDGTRNFERNTPLFGINIACAIDGILEAAGIYLPFTDELCLATRNGGTTLNGDKVCCAQTGLLAESYGIGPVRPSGKNTLPFLEALQKKYPAGNGPWMNGLGSPAMASVWVASGRRDWYLSHGSNIWDYAAPALIMQEAGCAITDIDGLPWQLGHRSIVAANQILHQELIALFAQGKTSA